MTQVICAVDVKPITIIAFNTSKICTSCNKECHRQQSFNDKTKQNTITTLDCGCCTKLNDIYSNLNENTIEKFINQILSNYYFIIRKCSCVGIVEIQYIAVIKWRYEPVKCDDVHIVSSTNLTMLDACKYFLDCTKEELDNINSRYHYFGKSLLDIFLEKVVTFKTIDEEHQKIFSDIKIKLDQIKLNQINQAIIAMINKQ